MKTQSGSRPGMNTRLVLVLLFWGLWGLAFRQGYAGTGGQVLPEIPEAVTSFGAAVADNSLFVYGGHLGAAHSYSTEDQSGKLFGLNLLQPTKWTELAGGPKLQGLAMVAHNGFLYRLGGFTARNDEAEAHDLWSSAECARFDIKRNAWTPLPSLPEPRSSFDAVVHEHSIYVIGGWAMRGTEGKKNWHKTAWVMNLEQGPLEWKPLPAPPFQRRALSVAALGQKIYAIGGMNIQGGPTRETGLLDLETQTWSKGPTLPGKQEMEGFGNSSFAVGKTLYCSTISGALYQLSEKEPDWKKILELPHKRFFHRMVPYQQNSLVLVGGASMDSGKVEEVDRVFVPEK